MNVADVMTPRSEVVTVEIPGTRDDALEYLQERSFSSVPVVKRTDGDEQYRGLLTRDTLIENPDENQLAMLMEEVPTVEQSVSVEEVSRLMSNGARRMPVVDSELEGIVTVTDVVRAVADERIPVESEVEDWASRDVNTVYQETPLTVAERELFYANVPYAVVLDDDGGMCGVVTEVDVIDVARVVEGEARTGDSIADQDDDWMWEGIKAVGNRYLPTREVKIPNGPVREFMTGDVVSVSTHRSIQDAAQLMIRHDIEQIPMVSGERLVGIVRDVDLLEALYD